MIKSGVVGAMLVAACGLVPMATKAAVITSYTIAGVPDSGFGGWSYDADTLNDGIVPTTEVDNMLLDYNLSPTITFNLGSLTNISTISILNNNPNNTIPGNIFSARITIGANSAVITSTGFGALSAAGNPLNELFTLPGSLSSIATTSFTLSDFTNVVGGFETFGALGEVVVNDSMVVGVPEPGTWTMLVVGFGLVGSAMRRRAIAEA